MSSLRKRLVVTFTVVAVTASFMVAGIGYQIVRGELLRRTESSAVDDVRDTMDRLTLPIGTSDLLWPNDASVTDDDLSNLVASLSGPDRQVIVEYGQEPPRFSEGAQVTQVDIPDDLRAAARTRIAYLTMTVDDQPTLVVGTDVKRQTGSGAVRSTGMSVFVFVSMTDVDRVLANLRAALLQAGSLTLVIALTVALLSARQVLLPVRRLGEAARALGAGRLDTRLPVHGRDELAELTATFNETAEALEQTVQELSSLEAMSRRFVADVSHELRTPLTTMTAVTDMLSDEAERLPPDAGQAVHLVVTEIERLRSLVDDLIEVSRFDSGAAVLRRESVDVGDELIECLEIRGWTDQVTLRVPDGLTYQLDPRRFDVIIANLVGNALKHGERPVTVTAKVLPSGLEVRVRDHGAGIPREDLPHVFDRFFKAGANRARSGGSGLGLSIAKANAELHRGTITVKLADPGTQFTLWIPRP
ncbi:HAMP domain-containing protein [Herbidospora sp. NEAU-GS84]|uniref:histidine kinase n=1 Tax=Herbidospora solisilvae TaxID=2696284 RepID=A0A7C9NSP3_9ACTN|nr:HAMP domain-containing sensor histidine kinase [Herbidospora solisilvae]NAS26716.1 HAMP domain-containing protein [Herbidospora solisilvae]